jgi:dCMP deaminase
MGAVIVSNEQRLVATGYNGPAAAWPESGECIEWCARAKGEAPLNNLYDECPAIHAEANALLYVDRSKSTNATVYVTSPPCMQCAKLISNSGASRVVCRIGEQDMHRRPETVLEYLKKCGIEVVIMKENNDNK